MRDPAVERWLDDFFLSCHHRQPVDATFIGVHDHDHALPDFTENGAGDALATMQELLARMPDATAVGVEPRTPGRMPSVEDPIAAIDLRSARGHLQLGIAEYESGHFHRGNPALYTGEAVFAVLSLFLTDFAPLPQRVTSAIERLARVPGFLDQARQNVRRAPVAWTERALRECEGALAFLTEGVARLSAGWTGAEVSARSAAHFAHAAEHAARAFAAFGNWLETDLRRRPANGEGCGPELFLRYLREGHALDLSAAEIEAFAEDALADARRALGPAIPAAGVRDVEEALERLAALHAPVDRYVARYGEIRAEVQRIVEEHDLVTWPDDPIRFVPRPAWVRAAAPHLYFLFYRSPAAFQRPDIHETLITPIEADMPPEQQVALLRATNDSVIRLNHVIHHGSIGHHVQNGHAHRSASRVGRIAAVDGASRIAMFCGGTMAEGWACYATDLMAEAGALSPLERVAEARGLIRMCVRAIVDVRLHDGRLTLDGAAAFYAQHAGMDHRAGRAEAVRNSMFPGTALMYLLGRNAIHELRDDMRVRMGNDFTLRAFHDTLLSYGSVPVALAAADMKRRWDGGASVPAAVAPAAQA